MTIIRVRSRGGMQRVAINNNPIAATVAHLKSIIETQLHVPIRDQTLSMNRNILLSKSPQDLAQFADMSNPTTPLTSFGISHGSIVYLYHEGEHFVPGPAVKLERALRKMTLDDLIAKKMRITRQEKPHCDLVSFDRDAANQFQKYVRERLSFSAKRGGFMYGTVSKSGEVRVDFIYEPPQQGTLQNLMLQRDPSEETLVEAIADGLGMRKVGFIFTQTIGQLSKEYTMSNRDVLQAVELQNEGGLKEWVTVVVRLGLNDEEGNAAVHFEAFQMSDICVRLFKEGRFEQQQKNRAGKVDPKLSRMKEEVVVGGKDTRDVDNDFFLVPVKILDHQGPLLSNFPVENRIDTVTSYMVKNHLEETMNLPFVKRISDFHLLLFISRFMDIGVDVPVLAACVATQVAPPEGYQLLIESLAGIA